MLLQTPTMMKEVRNERTVRFRNPMNNCASVCLRADEENHTLS